MIHTITDFFIVSLLIMAIIFCWRLNMRLKKMRELSEDLSPFMKTLASYVNNISTTIDKLRYVAELGDRSLNEKIPEANGLREDFDVLIEHAEKIAYRLDAVIEKARQMDQKLNQTMQKVNLSYHASTNQPLNEKGIFDKADYNAQAAASPSQSFPPPSQPLSGTGRLGGPIPHHERGIMEKLRGIR